MNIGDRIYATVKLSALRPELHGVSNLYDLTANPRWWAVAASFRIRGEQVVLCQSTSLTGEYVSFSLPNLDLKDPPCPTS